MRVAEVARIDFESRSACSLKLCGSWRYSLDPSTEVLCLAYRLPYWDAGRVDLWAPAFPQCGLAETFDPSLGEMFDWIEARLLVEAHNAFFERGIWQNIMMPKSGWPPILGAQWRCSAAKVAAHALPRSLDDASAALGLRIRKDLVGAKVMMKMNKPRKPRKAEREAGVTGLLWWETADLFQQLFAYCRQDVLTEEAVSRALPDLSDDEQALYALDQTINERGFRLDRIGIHSALRLIEEESTRLNGELARLTGGAVTKATQRAKLSRWLQGEGLYLADTQAATLDAYLAPESQTPLPGATRRALEILRALGRSSTAKYEAMANHICPDDRVRGGLLFHGASTGRWTGSGIQPHNLPKGVIKGFSMEQVWDHLCSI